METPAALSYLKKRGITSEAVEHFKIGYADRTLGLRLPDCGRKSGVEIRSRLKKVGILREETGHEHFNGSAVFPILDEHGHIGEIYGRKIQDHLRKGQRIIYIYPALMLGSLTAKR